MISVNIYVRPTLLSTVLAFDLFKKIYVFIYKREREGERGAEEEGERALSRL